MTARTVITGAGIVSSPGTGWTDFCNALNKSGFPASIEEKTSATPDAGLIKDFQVEKYLRSQKAYLDRSSQFLFAAVALALQDASLPQPDPDTALVTGTQFGSMETASLFYKDVIEKGPRSAKPFLFPHCYSTTAISLVSIEYGLKGSHLHLASGATAGMEAITAAVSMIESGKAKIAIAGGFDALPAILVEGLKCLSGNSQDGSIPSEGAGIFVIEELEHAIKRNAPVRGFISGAGIAGNMAGAMQMACKSQMPECTITSANGNRTMYEREDSAVALLTSEKKTAIYAIKPLIGETFSAGGPINLAAALYLIANNMADNVLASSSDSSGNSVCLMLSRG